MTPGLHRARVVDYVWGVGDAAAVLLPPPSIAGPALAAAAATLAANHPTSPLPPPPLPTFDAIVASDVVYEPAAYAALAATLRALAAPHTLVFLAFKSRGADADPECTSCVWGWKRQRVSTPGSASAPSACPAPLAGCPPPRWLHAGLQESSLLGLLEEGGFAVTEVSQAHLAPEYQCSSGGGGGGRDGGDSDDGRDLGAGSPAAAASTYRVLRACLI